MTIRSSRRQLIYRGTPLGVRSWPFGIVFAQIVRYLAAGLEPGTELINIAVGLGLPAGVRGAFREAREAAPVNHIAGFMVRHPQLRSGGE